MHLVALNFLSQHFIGFDGKRFDFNGQPGRVSPLCNCQFTALSKPSELFCLKSVVLTFLRGHIQVYNLVSQDRFQMNARFDDGLSSSGLFQLSGTHSTLIRQVRARQG